MNKSDPKYIRTKLQMYAKPNDNKAYALLCFDVLMYISAITFILITDNHILKLIAGISAGFTVSSLFVIAHDAAHSSFTSNKYLNSIIARICFLPSFHNYTLWKKVHNSSHHQFTNLKGMNTWSPLSYKEYKNLSIFGKMMEKIYRNVAGFGIYYMVERWWKNKFYPFKRISNIDKKQAMRDFYLVLAYFMSMIVVAFLLSEKGNVIQSFIYTTILPFLIWNYMGGFTTYQHHTHETINWYALSTNKREQIEITMHVVYPDWYNLISHNVMEHTAHHIDPRIPCYNLKDAEDEVTRLIGDAKHTVKFSFLRLFNTTRICKLYDYENNCWLDFNGNRVFDNSYNEIELIAA